MPTLWPGAPADFFRSSCCLGFQRKPGCCSWSVSHPGAFCLCPSSCSHPGQVLTSKENQGRPLRACTDPSSICSIFWRKLKCLILLSLSLGHLLLSCGKQTCLAPCMAQCWGPVKILSCPGGKAQAEMGLCQDHRDRGERGSLQGKGLLTPGCKLKCQGD